MRGTSANGAVWLLIAAFALIVLELNRPGLYVPGALGLLLALLGGLALAQHGMQAGPGVALVGAVALLLLNLWLRVPRWILVLAAAGLVASLRFLEPAGGGQRVGVATALMAGSVLGGGGAILSGIARCARRAKAVN